MKVCPFCQSKKLDMISPVHDGGFQVYCQDCHAEGPIKSSSEEAEKAWDYRPIPQRFEMALIKGGTDE